MKIEVLTELVLDKKNNKTNFVKNYNRTTKK
jgi:hypothetical protein